MNFCPSCCFWHADAAEDLNEGSGSEDEGEPDFEAGGNEGDSHVELCASSCCGRPGVSRHAAQATAALMWFTSIAVIL